MNTKSKSYTIWLKDIKHKDFPWIGNKAINISELYQSKYLVPNGFSISTEAFKYFLQTNNLTKKIRDIYNNTTFNNLKSLNSTRNKIQKLILDSQIPDDLLKLITKDYNKLATKNNYPVAVRSSSTMEDTLIESSAGQYSTYININNLKDFIISVKKVWASLYNSRIMYYYNSHKINPAKVGMGIIVQKMIQSEISGVMFTVNPVDNDNTIIVIESIWGLGELLVNGKVNPDHFELDNKNFRIIRKHISEQTIQLTQVGKTTKLRPVPKRLINSQKISDKFLKKIAQIGVEIHKYHKWPQDIEWAYYNNKIYILQTRPITTYTEKLEKKQVKIKKTTKKPIISGVVACPGVAIGKAVIINSSKDLNKVKYGDILVSRTTSINYVTIMPKVKAIVTEAENQTSHLAILSREFGIPCIISATKATQKISKNQIITVDAHNGNVYDGKTDLRFIKKPLPKGIKNLRDIKTKTKVMVTLSDPESALYASKKHVDGVGILKGELISLHYLAMHPREAILNKHQILYSTKLAESIEEFCRVFYPRPVVYRFSNFDNNKYRNFHNGYKHEKFINSQHKGAGRHIKLKELFLLELKAIKIVREKFSWKNLHVMLPYVRTTSELKEIKKILYEQNLRRSSNFKIHLSIDVPANIFEIDNLCKIGIDEININYDLLSAGLLGIHEYNADLKNQYNLTNNISNQVIKKIAKTAKKSNTKFSIYGDNFNISNTNIELIAKNRFSSISVSTDKIDKTRIMLFYAEKQN